LNGIDILVNNAGTIVVGPFETMTPADYRDSLTLHFWSPYLTSAAVLPGMKKRRHGRIVNISSIGGKISVPHLLPYSVGKFALAGFSEGLRSEASKDNVFVTTVYPGLMRTGSPRNAKFKGKHTAEYTWFSISDALPGMSMDAQRAAKQIIDACERGDARAVLSLPAKFAVKLNEMFPEFTAAILAAANRFLPSSGGVGRNSASGEESFTLLSPSLLTTLNERAAQQNNQIAS
jgi:short-subunit dehydrogenase